jgi:hypothetical protein
MDEKTQEIEKLKAEIQEVYDALGEEFTIVINGVIEKMNRIGELQEQMRVRDKPNPKLILMK